MITPPKGSSIAYQSSIPNQFKASTRGNAASPQVSELHFDQVNISRESSTAVQFRQECLSRLVREVRTAHTASDISRIKAEVQNGSYQPDAVEIAAKLLLEENNCGNE